MTEAPDTPPPTKSTAAQLTIGTALFMSMRWSMRFIGLFSTVILARILVPEDFGLVAIATSYIALINMMTELGLRNAVIHYKGEDRSFYDTVFTVQILRGIVIACAVLASSLVLPRAMGDERLYLIIYVIACEPLITSFISPKMALFEKDIDYRRELILQVGGKLIAAAVAISIAVAFQTYWALIIGLIFQSVFRLVVSHIFVPFLPRITLRAWRELFSFSGWLSASYIVDAFATGLDEMLVGIFVSVRSVGLYNVSVEVAGMPLGETVPAIARTLFPGLLRFRDDVEKLRHNALEVIGVIGALTLPAAVGFSFLAPEFVKLVYGEKWLEAIPLIQAIVLFFGIHVLTAEIALPVVMALGRTQLAFFRSLSIAVIRIPAFVYGISEYGLTGALVGVFVGSVAVAVADIIVLKVATGMRVLAVFARLWRALFSTGIMAIALIWFTGIIPPPETGFAMLGVLLAKLAVGAIAYGACRLLIWGVTRRAEALEVRLMQLFGAIANRAGGSR